MATFPFLVQPFYDPQSSYRGNADLAWLRDHAADSYVAHDGSISANGASNEGTLVDDPAAPVIEGTRAQRWQPANPADPRNAIYQAATLYGRNGIDQWILTQTGNAALADARANPLPVPTSVYAPVAVVAPVVPASPPPPPPGALAWLESLLSHWKGHN